MSNENKGLEDKLASLAELTAITHVRVLELESAIRNHRDQRGDDRCFLDDAQLYEVLKDGIKAETALPPRDVFLANCARYHACRQNPADSYETVVQERVALIAERDAANTMVDHWRGNAEITLRRAEDAEVRVAATVRAAISFAYECPTHQMAGYDPDCDACAAKNEGGYFLKVVDAVIAASKGVVK